MTIQPPRQSRRVRACLILCAASLALLALAPGAAASKKVSSFLGSPTGAAGATGGLLNGPIDVAINQTGAGGVPVGETYVAEASNRRIQEFSPSGVFVRIWGEDVIKPGAPNDTGTGFEICDTTAAVPNVASDCKAGTTTSTTGGSLHFSLGGLAVDQATGALYIGDGTHRRIQKFSATGDFIAAFGWDVQVGGVSTYEVCTVAASCQAGTGGQNGGQIGEVLGNTLVNSLAVGPAGDLYVAEAAKRRIQQFKSDGTFVSAWGWNVVPPGQIGDAGAAYERCPSLAASTPGACREGEHSAGSAPGHFGRIIEDSPYSVAVSSTGDVYATDLYGSDSNRALHRIVSFGPDGGSPSVFLDSEDPADSFLIPDEQVGGHLEDPLLAFGAGDHLFVRGFCGPLRCPDLPVGAEPEQRIFEFDETGAAVDSHMRRSDLRVRGIDVNKSTGDIYAVGFKPEGSRVFVLDEDGAPPPPAVSVLAPTEVGAHSVTFNGTVDPNGPVGIPTSYRFEYSRDGAEWNSVTGDPLSPADGVGAQAVSAKVTNLEANATYRVRLIAVKAFGASDEIVSPEVSFVTEGPAPEVETLGLQNFSDTGAVFSGRVNPNNRSTEYWFEFGETVDYGSRVPLSEKVLEGGISRYVSEQVEELEPGTVYHFRLVAESEAGVSAGADRTFTTRAAFAGFEPRAFEQISPRLKEADVQAGTGMHQGGEWAPSAPASADGNHVAFSIWGTIDSAEWGGDRRSKVLAHRTATGWELDDVSPRPLFPSAGQSGASLGGLGGGDLSKQLIFAQNDLLVGPPGIYLSDSNADQITNVAPLANARDNALAVSPGLDRMAIGTTAMLTSQPGLPGPDDLKVFEWDAGELHLVSVRDDETPFATGQVGSGNGDSGSVLNAMSTDGRHVFFTAPYGETTAANVYRRDNREETVLVSPSKRTPADPQGPQAKVYLDSTADQSDIGPAAVFFASKEKLTDAPTNTSPASAGLGDLYRYEVNTDTLTNISAEVNDAQGARVLGMLGRSEDGDRVYYVAAGRVVAGQGVEGQPNLYAWHDDGTAAGETRFVATLGNSACEPVTSATYGFPAGGDTCNWTTEQGGTAAYRTSRVTSDGKRLLFQSDLSLTGYPSQGMNEVFLYEVDANGSGHLSCLSCDPDGTPSVADSDLSPQGSPAFFWIGTYGQDPVRSMSADGRRVFFNTPASLLPEDTNGKRDVYGWSEGHLVLISTGKSNDDSLFSNASADGRTVFLTTRQQLVGVDNDGLADLYAARIGGGFDFQNPPPPGVPCAGDGCKPTPASQPAAPPVGSPGFFGPGNQPPGKKKPHKKKHKKKKHSKKHKKGHGKAHGKNAKSKKKGGKRNG